MYPVAVHLSIARSENEGRQSTPGASESASFVNGRLNAAMNREKNVLAASSARIGEHDRIVAPVRGHLLLAVDRRCIVLQRFVIHD